jgi:hypothetical protein
MHVQIVTAVNEFTLPIDTKQRQWGQKTNACSEPSERINGSVFVEQSKNATDYDNNRRGEWLHRASEFVTVTVRNCPVAAAGERRCCGPLWIGFSHKMPGPFSVYCSR